MAAPDTPRMRRFLISKSGVVLMTFLAVAGYFLWAEHKAHVQAYLPLIVILGLCLGMHAFMHGGHGGHSGGVDAGANDEAPNSDDRRAP